MRSFCPYLLKLGLGFGGLRVFLLIKRGMTLGTISLISFALLLKLKPWKEI